tara:strand:+ start:1467 stop:3668 length:2202 start_codon:yes stop_codon:yes gene_type:complete
MIKKIFLTIGLFLILISVFVIYLSLVGVETAKFNSFIKNEVKSYNNKFDVNLKEVKLKLDIKNFNINIYTSEPIIIYSNNEIPLEKLSFSFSINSYLNQTFGVNRVSIESKYNKISNFVDIYQKVSGSAKFYILSKTIKDGEAKFNADFEFDEKGKILPNYIIYGDIKKSNINLFNDYNFNNINFDFEFKESNYNLKNIYFNFNKIDFNSKKILIQKKDKIYKTQGEIENESALLNKEILSIFYKDYENYFNIDKSKILSNSKFSFDITKKFKIKNLKINSNLKIDEVKYLSNSSKVKKYLPEYKKEIYFRDNVIDISFSKNNYQFTGSSKYFLNEFSDNISFKVNKLEDLYNFNIDINFDNSEILLEELSYSKAKNKKSNLKIIGKYTKNKNLLFKNINYKEEKNLFNIENFLINKNLKIIKFDKISNNYITNNQIKNDYSIVFKNNKYLISGAIYDGVKLLDNMFEDSDTNFFNIFDNLSSKVIVNLKKAYIDKVNYINNLKVIIDFKNNKIKNLILDSNYTNNKKLKLTINTTKNGEKVTTVTSDYPKPLVSRYKFIKGFENGILDFQSIKKNNVSKSVLKIDNFKVKEVPALAKLLSLASLQGIADTLTGEGIRFTDFEMLFSNKDNLVTIDEIYAIGPAISILMDGYIEKNNLISLRGTLVPARTINRTISSIPLIGDILIGKKVGEGVFGVSFKIKGPPKKLKTTVNPIKTLTPRFITRTLEKIKKN